MMRSRKQLVKPCGSLEVAHPKAQELLTAKEILADTFGISIPEVDDMIRLRCEEMETWPEQLLL